MSAINYAWAYVMSTVVTRKHDEEKGATAVEYGLMVGLIAIAIIVAVTTLGTKLSDLFDGVGNKIPAPAATTTP